MCSRTALSRRENGAVSETTRDLLVLAKTVGANEFPVERPSVIGVDRETGALLRLPPFPWKGAGRGPPGGRPAGGPGPPPVRRWSWVQVEAGPAPRDPRRDSREVSGEVVANAYIEARDGWKLRRPFIRPHEHASLEAFQESAKDGGPTLGYVRPRDDADLMQLPLRLLFRCAEGPCTAPHELPVLDWELHEMSRLAREREGSRWATAFRERWGAPFFARYDVRILVSLYAQSPSKPYVAGLFYPPREAEDAHAHAHHVAHRGHQGEDPRAAEA